MRDIKFRFWSGKEYEDPADFMIFGDGCIYERTEYNDTVIIVSRAGFIPEQYTGLKDKNGVEIYEGDVVKHAHYPDCKEIKFFEGAFVWGYCYSASTLTNYNCPRHMQVIGNIHDNPELLESE